MASESSYRERALKLFPWICGRCAREFPASRLRELTVHHKNGNHDDNPLDGSNWDLLCIYCHENEHARVLDSKAGGESRQADKTQATHKALAGLEALVRNKKKD